MERLVATPAVTVIVPARDARATLERALEAIASQRIDQPYEVIVVDAGSRDGSADIARAAGARVIAAGPMGPAEARNRGAAQAAAKCLAFTDADCYPEPDWLASGLDALAEAALVQGRVVPDPSAAIGPFDRFVAVSGENGLYETANLFVRRDVFERIGGFVEWLRPEMGAPHMGEDLQFGWRVRRSGARTAFCADAVVQHAVFKRGPLGFIAEHRRRRYFVDIAREVPELRREMFFARYFLSRRTAAFDLALLSLAVSAIRRSPLPLMGAVPYLAELRSGRGGVQADVAGVVADTVGWWGLLNRSVRLRTPVL